MGNSTSQQQTKLYGKYRDMNDCIVYQQKRVNEIESVQKSKIDVNTVYQENRESNNGVDASRDSEFVFQLPEELLENIVFLADLTTVGKFLQVNHKWKNYAKKLIDNRRFHVDNITIRYPSNLLQWINPNCALNVFVRSDFDYGEDAENGQIEFTVPMKDLPDAILKFSPLSLHLTAPMDNGSNGSNRLQPLRKMPAWWLQNIEKLEISGSARCPELLSLLGVMPSLHTFSSTNLKIHSHSASDVIDKMSAVRSIRLNDDESTYSDVVIESLIRKSHKTQMGLQYLWLPSMASQISPEKLIEFFKFGNFSKTCTNIFFFCKIDDSKNKLDKWIRKHCDVEDVVIHYYVFNFRNFKFDLKINHVK